jgi:hypothetical protein
MGVQMMLEADRRLTMEEAANILQSCGYISIVPQKKFNGFVATSPQMPMPTHYRSRGGEVEVYTDDGKYKPAWRASCLISMKMVDTERDLCRKLLHDLVTKLSETSAAYFVLSAQYERILSLRDESGIKHFQEEWVRQFGEPY